MNTANVDVLLTITAQPGLEETLVDWLLTKKSGQGFSSFPIDGHSNHHEGLTLSEQVRGRKRSIQFQIQLNAEELPSIVRSLENKFSGTGLHYWVTPITQHGRI
ncbi:MAG: DUF3240 family protein [Methylococcales bacterium]